MLGMMIMNYHMVKIFKTIYKSFSTQLTPVGHSQPKRLFGLLVKLNETLDFRNFE